MIGDILNDVEAGNRAGCQSILIDNGNETEWVMNDRRQPDSPG
jgi:D-glycero-D-manno-heptose 1,7-bisphosphate phosphatase